MNISYRIIRSSRKTIAIQIKPDGQVVVRCPKRMRERDVRAYVDSKSGWIEKHLANRTTEEIAPFSAEKIESLRRKARPMIEERAAHYAQIMGVSYHRITIRAQRTRWGSCSSKGNLNFNCLLALVPNEVLDYVVVHELCHLKEMNHSDRFWAQLQSILLDYIERKRWLDEYGRSLIRRL